MWDKLRIDKKLGIERKYVNIAILVVIVGVLLFGAYEIISRSNVFLAMVNSFLFRLWDILTPITTAFIMAYLLFGPVIYLQKVLQRVFKKENQSKYNGIFRITSVTLVFLIIILGISLIFNFIIPPLLENAKSLINNIPEYEEVVMSWINYGNEYFKSLNIDYSTIKPVVDKMGSMMSVFSQNLVVMITNGITSISSFIIDFVLAIILTFYFLKDKENLFRSFDKFGKAFMPGKIGIGFRRFLKDLDEVFGGFIKGVILDAVIVGIVSSILMLLIKHPFAILVGVIAGISNVIPYIGPLIGGLVALILGAFTNVRLGVLGFALLILYQQIDGNIVQPKIVGDKVGLAPVWTLMALTIGGAYYGAMGMILSIPIAALVSVYINRYYKKKSIE